MNIPQLFNQEIANEKNESCDFHHHPSSFGKCIRERLYEWGGVRKTNPRNIDSTTVMWMGTILHQHILEKLEKILDIEIEEKKIINHPELKYPISLTPDAISRDRKFIIEIKTTAYWNEKLSIRSRDYYQVQGYMYFLDIPKCYLLYFEKTSGRKYQYVVDNDYEKVGQYPGSMLGRLQFFENYFEKIEEIKSGKEKPPPREGMVAIQNGNIVWKYQYRRKQYKSDQQCYSCQWRDRCWDFYTEKYRSEENNAEMFGGQNGTENGISDTR